MSAFTEAIAFAGSRDFLLGLLLFGFCSGLVALQTHIDRTAGGCDTTGRFERIVLFIIPASFAYISCVWVMLATAIALFRWTSALPSAGS